MKPIATPVWAYVALGSNLGDSRTLIGAACERLQALSAQAVQVSSLWQTAPVDCPPGSPPFLNAVLALVPWPGETPESLLPKLQALERAFGRQPKVQVNEPRPLDLDLIAFGREVRESGALILPHPRAHRRKFVLAPLNEIAPDLVLPGQAASVRELLAECSGGEEAVRVGPVQPGLDARNDGRGQ